MKPFAKNEPFVSLDGPRNGKDAKHVASAVGGLRMFFFNVNSTVYIIRPEHSLNRLEAPK
jgi:hypothetical protein